MLTKNDEIPKYDIAIEWVTLIIYVGMMIINMALTVYLIQGRLKNQRISKYLTPMAIVEMVWAITQLIENNIFHNQFWSVLNMLWAYLLTFLSATINAEVLKTFSVLSTIWNRQRVFYYQILLLVLHILLCGGAYIKLVVDMGGFVSIVKLAESVWLLLVALNNSLCSFYVVFLVYRDSKEMKARGKSTPISTSHYLKFICLLICNGLIDFVGVSLYIYGILTTYPDTSLGIRMNYALQRIASSPLGLHCFMITRIFIHLRYMKFSKEMSVKNQPKHDPQKTIGHK
ncbi:hypothetical protein BC833DRAFT_605844 [Globomyces pollinis-pini]|nr:hypothetical protein BC833DRAFT_605844 [Globomyces pollinis-pini]